MQPLRMGMFDMAVPTNPKIGSPPVYRRRAAPTQPQFIYYWRPWRSWLVGTNWSEPHAGLIGVPQSGTSQACPGESNIKWSPYVYEKRGWDMAWDVVVTCAAYHACCGALEVRGVVLVGAARAELALVVEHRKQPAWRKRAMAHGAARQDRPSEPATNK